MATRTSTSLSLPLLHVILALFCLWNISFISDRARVPFSTASQDGQVLIEEITDREQAGGLQEGDRIVFWKVVRVGMPEHLELLADLSSIGDPVRIQIERDDQLMMRTVTLVPFYTSYRFAVVTAVTGMAILLFALFVYLKRPGDPAALFLHWALVSLATVTMMTQGAIEQHSFLSEVRRAMMFLSYNMTAACFLLFTTRFPRKLFSNGRFSAAVLIGGFTVLAGALSWYHSMAMRTLDAEVFRSFQSLYDVFHAAFLLALVAGLGIILSGYVRERLRERKGALRWIFYGLLVGATPFLVLVVLPQLWGPDLLAPEELAIFFTLAIPLSFTVAFLRYHVFSIEIQHRQRLTTLLLRVALSMLQVLFVMIVLSIFWEDILFGSYTMETLVFGLGIVLISPVRIGLASLIEEAVFPARFNPTRLLQDASSRFNGLMIPAEVGPSLIRELHQIIPRFTFVWYRWNGRSMVGRASTDTGFVPSLKLSPILTDDIKKGVLITRRGAIRSPDMRIDPNHEDWLNNQGLALAIPFREESGSLLGMMCCRKHDGADPLDRGEFELIRTMSAQASSVLEHLRLQERMMLEQRKRREVEELSRLKSHFVSSVSHDLRTPLTSMGMFLELLEQPKLSARKRTEYIGFIRQESGRLRRLVENVLDFARAERGAKEFTLEPTELSTVLRAATDAMAGQFAAVRARYQVKIPRKLPVIDADPQALERAFVNLLSNAYKYTPEKKQVSFVARKERSIVRIDISDNGFGIPEKDLTRIFDPFFRVRDPATAPSGGVGLGLSLVKRTIEFHGGTIDIRSRQTKGSTVTVRLPIEHQRKGS